MNHDMHVHCITCYDMHYITHYNMHCNMHIVSYACYWDPAGPKGTQLYMLPGPNGTLQDPPGPSNRPTKQYKPSTSHMSTSTSHMSATMHYNMRVSNYACCRDPMGPVSYTHLTLPTTPYV